MAIYEYETCEGTVRALYQTLTTNSSNGYFESFMGDEGTLVISEASSRGEIYREGWVPAEKWDKWVKTGHIALPPEDPTAVVDPNAVLDSRESPKPPKYDLPVEMDKPYHQPHLENFFDSVRGKATLNCPAEIGYETAVTVLKVNESVEAGRKLEFKPEEFKV